MFSSQKAAFHPKHHLVAHTFLSPDVLCHAQDRLVRRQVLAEETITAGGAIEASAAIAHVKGQVLLETTGLVGLNC